jgi:hypothetical protein
MDTGAQKSVIGNIQAESYCRENNTRYNLDLSALSSLSLFKLGSSLAQSIGMIRISIIIPGPSNFIELCVDVVNVDIPLLLGLDFLDKHHLNPLCVQNQLWCVTEQWSIPIVRKNGHLHLRWNPTSFINFSRSQLDRLHKHFFHPSAGKLWNLLNIAYPSSMCSNTLALLKNISSSCETCIRYSTAPISFQVRMPDEIVFNKELKLDLMYLKVDGKQVSTLTIVDAGTTFSGASFLIFSSSKAVWNAFLKCWTTMYTGFPISMLTDQGSIFTSADWHAACNSAKVQLRYTDTESHNSLGTGERYHGPFRRIFSKVSDAYPSVSADLRLSLSVKAMNDYVGAEGLVPSLLVFGVMPRLPDFTTEVPSQLERFKCLYQARKEYEWWVCAQRIRTALKRRLPPASYYIFRPGDRVAVYRKRLRE